MTHNYTLPICHAFVLVISVIGSILASLPAAYTAGKCFSIGKLTLDFGKIVSNMNIITGVFNFQVERYVSAGLEVLSAFVEHIMSLIDTFDGHE
ncbi:hypothetical protein Clacol_003137 [Clathrus columnatus]|uniref:Uncharacterized protein n=1 Tax=Clathrus columnatus TaxID=1419009 RepID=A0AAV5A5J1_9AGAM|nr:hypothetical protein Clacol_003137 [Clathrus columnatus]